MKKIEVNLIRGQIVKRLVETLRIVELEPLAKPLSEFGTIFKRPKVKILVLERPPQPLNENIVLDYANANRPWQMYRDLFYQTLEVCKVAAPGKHRFRFKNKLLSLDSSTISLCLSLFPWAKFCRTKGAVKLHLLLDHDGYLPTFAYISNGQKHDVTIARKVPLSPHSIVAMDRGYNDYRLFAYWTDNQIFFVTRLKENADYTVVEDRPVPINRNIIADQLIEFNGYYAHKKCPHILRKVVVWDAEQSREIVLLTNHLHFGATTISAIYKDRWHIELFFKALKQNLKVKTFVGTPVKMHFSFKFGQHRSLCCLSSTCSSNPPLVGLYRIWLPFSGGIFLLTRIYGSGSLNPLKFYQ